jgi:hypothetical protein
MQERLSLTIGSEKDGRSQRVEALVPDDLKKRLEQYDRQRIRGPQVGKFFDALCNMQPTSTQPKRNFSGKLSAIMFLKCFFSNQN